jgi:FkbM family methyltransferase
MTDPRLAPTTRSQDDLIWVVRPGTDDHLGPAFHERPLIELALGLCHRGAHFIDIGAHVGTWSVRMAAAGRLVTALEPVPATHAALLQNLRLNGLSDRVSHWCCGAWDRDTCGATTNAHGMVSGGSTRTDEMDSLDPQDRPTTEVRLVRTDKFLPVSETTLHPRPLIKIDVEGNEDKVIYGAAPWIRQHRPRLIVELHDRPYRNPALASRALEALASLNYTWSERIAYGGCDYIVASHPSAVIGAPTPAPLTQETP